MGQKGDFFGDTIMEFGRSKKTTKYLRLACNLNRDSKSRPPEFEGGFLIMIS